MVLRQGKKGRTRNLATAMVAPIEWCQIEEDHLIRQFVQVTITYRQLPQEKRPLKPGSGYMYSAVRILHPNYVSRTKPDKCIAFRGNRSQSITQFIIYYINLQNYIHLLRNPIASQSDNIIGQLVFPDDCLPPKAKYPTKSELKAIIDNWAYCCRYHFIIKRSYFSTSS